MAETNLGQVVGIWLESTEPPHKNVLWIKTTNLLTSEKAGFIWNGIEWVNIQGLGFTWKGEFDENTDYTKNDVVKFENKLYIKLNDIANNGDSPDVSSDFDLFITSAAPVGEEGSVQVKDANGNFFGSNLFKWIGSVLSILGGVSIKGNSSSSGEALDVKNASNVRVLTATNQGYVLLNRFGYSTSTYTLVNAGGFVCYVGGDIKFQVLTTGLQTEALMTASIINCSSYANPTNTTHSAQNMFVRTNDLNVQAQAQIDIIGGQNTLAKSAKIRLGYKKNNVENYSLVIDEKDMKMGFVDGKHGFYGTAPVAKQNLSTNPTNAELATALSNLGLVNLITP